MPADHEILAGARELLADESRALAVLVETLDDDFVRAVRLLASCEGRVVTTGMGKAGIIGRKVGATLSSTGTPAHFLHPAEALHGDLGQVTSHDVVLALSNSGNTEELVRLLGPLRDIGARVVAIVGDDDSALARHADVVLDYGDVTEVCPLGLAPTTSTTVMLALGDALAMAVLRERDFSTEEFARFHPAGNLGRSLMKVAEVMRTDEGLPLVPVDADLTRTVEIMTTTPGRPGAVVVVDGEGRFAGFYTDGDLRRNLLEALDGDARELARFRVADVMTTDPVTVGPDELVGSAMRLLRERRVDQLAVVDAARRPVGLLDIQDILDLRAFGWGGKS